MAKVSKSASIEDLKEKNAQIEMELSKLADEVREVVKKQEETSRAIEDKLSSLGMLLERSLRQNTGKGPSLHVGESSNNNGMNRNQRIEIEADRLETQMEINSEELNWAENNVRNRERMVRTENRRTSQLPRMDFPHFDGTDPKMWQLNCEFYFDMYEVPEIYKTRMAVMNFSGEINEWYRCLTTRGGQLPWDILVEEIMNRFQNQNMKDPVDEFKRIHQTGKVDEFIRRFDRVRSRLLIDKPALDEGFFISGFISGLKEELRYQVEICNPRTLNQVFQYATKVEAAVETLNRKPREGLRSFKYQKPISPLLKQKTENDRPAFRGEQFQKPWQQKTGYQAPTYEQKKELGLCHKCHGKYFPGHQCTGKVMNLQGEEDSEQEEIEENDEHHGSVMNLRKKLSKQ